MEKNRAFTLIESLIAIFLVAVGVAGAFILVNQTVSSGRNLTSRIIANYLVQEGMEIVRYVRDTNLVKGLNWSDGLDSCGAGCEADYTSISLPPFTGQKFKIESGFYKYSLVAGAETPFWRKITIGTAELPNKIEVLVEVFWLERNQTNETSAKEFLYKW